MGIWESALILLGVGIVSSRFKAGVGLQELGLGIRELGAAPLGGIGTGLGEFAGGLRSFAESLGDIGRGFGELFKHIPKVQPGTPQPWWYPPMEEGNGNGGPLIPVGGGDDTTNLPGGGGNVPNGRIFTLGTDIGPITGTYASIWGFYATRGFTPSQIRPLLNPIWGFNPDVGLDTGLNYV